MANKHYELVKIQQQERPDKDFCTVVYAVIKDQDGKSWYWPTNHPLVPVGWLYRTFHDRDMETFSASVEALIETLNNPMIESSL